MVGAIVPELSSQHSMCALDKVDSRCFYLVVLVGFREACNSHQESERVVVPCAVVWVEPGLQWQVVFEVGPRC